MLFNIAVHSNPIPFMFLGLPADGSTSSGGAVAAVASDVSTGSETGSEGGSEPPTEDNSGAPPFSNSFLCCHTGVHES
jgi:hypothetical protein